MSLISSHKINKVIYLDQTESTNDEALNHINTDIDKQNTMIYTFSQTNGRGQIGRTWFTGENQNLAVSSILHFNQFEAHLYNHLNFWIALTVYSFLTEVLEIENCSIKWPNDIYIGNKKIAGLLVQSSIQGKYINNAVFGVGLNINQDSFPKHLPNPTSIYLELGKKQLIKELFFKFLDHFNDCLPSLSLSNFKMLHKKYHNYLYLKDVKHTFVNNKTQEQFEGIIKGVDESGMIIISKNQKEQLFKFKEISY